MLGFSFINVTTATPSTTTTAQNCAKLLTECLPKLKDICDNAPVSPASSGFGYRDFMEMFAWILFGLYVSSFIFYLVYCLLSSKYIFFDKVISINEIIDDDT